MAEPFGVVDGFQSGEPVEPAGVETTSPSQRTSPSSSPVTEYASSATRPFWRRWKDMSLIATASPSAVWATSAGSSMTSKSPARA